MAICPQNKNCRRELTFRMSDEADLPLAAEFAPAIAKCPPGNFFCRSVLPALRDFASETRPRSAGVSLSIGARRSFDHVSAISSEGCRTRIGAASWSIWNPTTLLMTSVFPTCEDVMTTTR